MVTAQVNQVKMITTNFNSVLFADLSVKCNGFMALPFCIRKEGNILFNDALNTFLFSYMALEIW